MRKFISRFVFVFSDCDFSVENQINTLVSGSRETRGLKWFVRDLTSWNNRPRNKEDKKSLS